MAQVPSLLEGLLAEMDKGGDFPTLSRTITEINHAVGDENSRATRLTEIILRDISLTKNLLRLVNAAYYGSFGGQAISTISRAVVILGFDAVRNVAVSLMLFEHLKNHAHGEVLRGEAVNSFYRGILGRLLAASVGVRDPEEAFICALFRDLGRLMARFHFFDRTLQVEKLMEEEFLDEASASRKILGVDYDELGLAVAKHWNFPSPLLYAMTPTDAQPMKGAAASDSGRLQVVANLARDLHRGVAGKSPEAQQQAIDALVVRYREGARISRESLMETAYKAAQTLCSDAAFLNADIGKSPIVRQLLHTQEEIPEAPPEEDTGCDPINLLALGMQDMAAMMLGEYHLSDIFKLVAELFYRTGLFDHVLISVLDRPSHCLIGRVCLGTGSAQLRGQFSVPLAFAADVFHAAIVKGQDILIADATAENIRSRIPEWHVHAFHAHSLMLLPVMVNGKPIGMIYTDKRDAPLCIPTQVLSLLKALRNQATLALHHKR